MIHQSWLQRATLMLRPHGTGDALRQSVRHGIQMLTMFHSAHQMKRHPMNNPAHRSPILPTEKHPLLPIANVSGKSTPCPRPKSTWLHVPRFLSPPSSLQLHQPSRIASPVAKQNPRPLGLTASLPYSLYLFLPHQPLNVTTVRSESYSRSARTLLNAIRTNHEWTLLR